MAFSQDFTFSWMWRHYSFWWQMYSKWIDHGKITRPRNKARTAGALFLLGLILPALFGEYRSSGTLDLCQSKWTVYSAISLLLLSLTLVCCVERLKLKSNFHVTKFTYGPKGLLLFTFYMWPFNCLEIISHQKMWFCMFQLILFHQIIYQGVRQYQTYQSIH